MRFKLLFISIFTPMLAITGFAQNQPAATPTLSNSAMPQTSSQAPPSSLRIGPGDLLQISVFGAPDFNTETRVAENGDVTLPLIGSVKAGGQTVLDFSKLLQSRLASGGYFNDPHVAVFVKEYASENVSVLGEVQKPGIYPLLGPRTLFDAISAAQGTTQTASDTVTIIHRDHPQQPETIKAAYGPRRSPGSNVSVYPGDTVIVEKAGVVYVVGAVQKPAGIVMESSDLTVIKAIAMAQGANPEAALDKAKLIRKTQQGPQEIPINLKRMLAAQIPDMAVQPEDVIFVPSSAAKSAGKRALEAAIQTATGIAIYRR